MRSHPSSPNPGEILLVRFAPQVGQPYGNKSISPFGIKLESFLRLANIPYHYAAPSISAILHTPKRKLPFVVTDAGVTVFDSSFIIDHLFQTAPYAQRCQTNLCDAALSQEQRSIGTAVKMMCEDSLYFIVGYWRYVDDNGFSRYTDINPTLQNVPMSWIRKLLERFARRAITKQLWAQGMARHTRPEIEGLGRDCLESIAGLLTREPGPFLFGSTPSRFDATVFGFLSSVIEIDLDCPLKSDAKSMREIVDYLQIVNSKCGWREVGDANLNLQTSRSES